MILSSKTKESIKTALAMTIAWFAQERWTFMLFLSIFTGWCAYLLSGGRPQE